MPAGDDGSAPGDHHGTARPPWRLVLRALREARGVTQEGWAAQLGVGRRTVQRWERGEVPPDPIAEISLLAYCREKALFRSYDRGPLADLTVTAEWLQSLLIEARLSAGSRRAPSAAEETRSLAAATPAEPPDLPSGTVTLLFTDIEGSTHLLHQLGDDRYPELLATQRDLLRTVVRLHGGFEVDTQGDAFFVVFTSAVEAVAAAVAAQRALAAHPWPDGVVLRVRMGLHTGTPWRTAEGYAGLDLHRGARIAHTAHGGQVLLSAATATLTAHALPAGVGLRDLGRHRLKDLPEPEQLWQLVISGLAADFPPPRSLDSRPNNLPASPTPLVGREAEIEAVHTLLRRDGMRLVTLTGPGGVGKTRLALRVAADALHDYVDGAFVVPLAPLRDPEYILPAVAQTLAVREPGATDLPTALAASLRDRHLLLVLDNCEHLIAAAPLIGRLLAAAPHVTVLATSRAPLRLAGEHEYPVPPLAVPPDAAGALPSPAEVLAAPAVTLFVERAQAVRPDFTLTPANAPVVAAICRRLDGLPLALELAAARVKVLSAGDLLTRLRRRLGLLTGGARDLPERQQALRATLDWSYDLLAPGERLLLGRLSVFVGGFDLPAAEAVCGSVGATAADDDVLDHLGGLVDQSLVKAETAPDGGIRYRMLETIREYAGERLAAAGEEAAVRDRHLAWYLALAERAVSDLTGPEQARRLAELEREHDNLRAALAWSLAGQDDAVAALRLAGALWRFWTIHGHLSEGRSWLERALAAGAGAPVVARLNALDGAGQIAGEQGDYARAETLIAEALATRRAIEDRRGIAISLHQLGVVAKNQGDLDRAGSFFEEALAIRRAIGEPWGIAVALSGLANLAFAQADYPRAARLHEEALALWRETGDRQSTAVALDNLGCIARDQGDYGRAEAFHLDALSIFEELGDGRQIAYCLEGLAVVAVRSGRPERAAWLYGAAERLRETLGSVLSPAGRAAHERHLAAARAALPATDFQAAWDEGRAAPLATTIALARRVTARA